MALTITRLHSEIRAEVSGVDLGAPLDAPTRHALSLALADHLALVFHGQTLTPDRFLAAASAFGPPMEQHYTNRERPPAATLLYGVEIPSVVLLETRPRVDRGYRDACLEAFGPVRPERDRR